MWLIFLFVFVGLPILAVITLVIVAATSYVDSAEAQYRKAKGKKAPPPQPPQHYMDWPF